MFARVLVPSRHMAGLGLLHWHWHGFGRRLDLGLADSLQLRTYDFSLGGVHLLASFVVRFCGIHSLAAPTALRLRRQHVVWSAGWLCCQTSFAICLRACLSNCWLACVLHAATVWKTSRTKHQLTMWFLFKWILPFHNCTHTNLFTCIMHTG